MSDDGRAALIDQRSQNQFTLMAAVARSVGRSDSYGTVMTLCTRIVALHLSALNTTQHIIVHSFIRLAIIVSLGTKNTPT